MCICTLFFLILSSGSTGYGANNDGEIQEQLNKVFKNKNLIIRNFYSGSKLLYDSEGKLASGGNPGTWTVNGLFQPDKVKLSKKYIELSGKRLYWFYNSAMKGPRLYLRNKTIIKVARTQEQNNLSLVLAPLKKVFLDGNDQLEDNVPVYWKNIIKANFEPGRGDGMNWNEKPPDSIIPPRVLYQPVPSYTQEARMVRAEGIIVLGVIISEEGTVEVKDIIRPLGGGLEESAIETCKTWKFAPSLQNGIPIKFKSIIEVVFRLY